MDKQTAYNRIRAHFSKPGAEFAFNAEDRSCYYRVGYKPYSKKRCAVGVLIPDGKYAAAEVKSDLEGLSPDQVCEWLWPDADEDLKAFLSVCQNLHDYSAMNQWQSSLDEFYSREVYIPNRPGSIKISGNTIKSFLEDLDEYARIEGLSVN